MQNLLKKIVILIVSFFAVYCVNALDLDSTNIGQYCDITNNFCFLNNRGISNITSDTFSGYVNLVYLDLSYNNITTLDSNIFSGIKFTRLILENNSLKNLDPNIFSNQTGGYISLKNNCLTQNNFITQANIDYDPQRICEPIGELNSTNIQKYCSLTGTECNLVNGGITSIAPGTFSGFQILQVLGLNLNQLTGVYNGEFDYLTGLQQLHIAGNQISSIEPGSFDNMTGLNLIYLIYNTLTNLDPNLFNSQPENSQIYLQYNCLDPQTTSFNNTGVQILITQNDPNNPDQFVCPQVVYDPATTTTGQVVGTVVFTGGTSGQRDILNQSNSGNAALTHNWDSNGNYMFDLIGLNNLTGNLIQLAVMNSNQEVLFPFYTSVTGNVDWIIPYILPVSSSSSSSSSSNTSSSTISSEISSSSSNSSLSSNIDSSIISSQNFISSTVSSIISISSSSVSSSSLSAIYGGGGGGWMNGNYSSSSISNYSTQNSVSSVSSSSNSTNPKISSVSEAFDWAKQNNIISEKNYGDFKPYGPLLRKDLAMFATQFATNILKKNVISKPDCRFDDIKNETWEYQNFILQACNLGMMGYKPDGISVYQPEFWPNQPVTRAQFGSVLSRLLWGDKYSMPNNLANIYYLKHLQALKDNNILSDISHPDQIELRGWVLLMFFRYSQGL